MCGSYLRLNICNFIVLLEYSEITVRNNLIKLRTLGLCGIIGGSSEYEAKLVKLRWYYFSPTPTPLAIWFGVWCSSRQVVIERRM